jgi:hypothetical protein
MGYGRSRLARLDRDCSGDGSTDQILDVQPKINSETVCPSDGRPDQGCSVLSYIGHFGDLAEAAKSVGVAVLAD